MHRTIRCAAGAAAALAFAAATPAVAAPKCNLGNGIKHIVYLQFDNVHLHRDKPNVPSDPFAPRGASGSQRFDLARFCWSQQSHSQRARRLLSVI
jgi:hypothetical protein